MTGIELNDAVGLKPRVKETLARAMSLAISARAGSEITPEDVEYYLRNHRIPSVGVGGTIWHPSIHLGNMREFSVNDLLARWAMCFLFSVGLSIDGGRSSLFVNNYNRATASHVPICVTPRGFIGWGVSPRILVKALECGNNSDGHTSTLTRMRGKLVSSKGVHVAAGDHTVFNYNPVATLRLAPVRVTPDQASTSFRGRAMTIDPQQNYWSHDLQIADAVLTMRYTGMNNQLVIWTPQYMLVVSYTAPTPSNPKEYATAYLHTGARVSRIAPSYHAGSAVEQTEDSKMRVHFAAHGIPGSKGYMRALVDTNKDIMLSLDVNASAE